MFQLIESQMLRTHMVHILLETVATFEEALLKVEAMGAICLEEDADHEGCADAFLRDGRIMMIQPEGFTLEKEVCYA
jgi:hypothetical protein